MTRRLLWVTWLAAAVAGAQQTAPPKTHLKVGDTAPDFTVPAAAIRPVRTSSSPISAVRRPLCWHSFQPRSPVVERRN